MSNLPDTPWNKGEKYGRKHTEVCSLEGCSRPFWANHLCKTHNAQQSRGVTPYLVPPRRGRGEGALTEDGYLKMWDNDRKRRVFHHRQVMEIKLGRELRDNENVHHINGVRDDNRPENLELWVVSQPKGQRSQDLVAWANEILLLYGEEVKKECS